MRKLCALLIAEALMVVAGSSMVAMMIFPHSATDTAAVPLPVIPLAEFFEPVPHSLVLLESVEYTPQVVTLDNAEYIPIDVPVSLETQLYISELCEQYSVPDKLIYAIMEHESNYTADAISRTNDYGIMQINQVNHEWLGAELGITDFLDEKQNILAGVYMLSDLYSRFDETEKVLMAYNCGPTGAKRLWDQGITQTDYSKSVLLKMEELE